MCIRDSPQVDDVQAAALQHHLDQVFADVVQIALDGTDDRCALGLHARLGQIGLEDGHTGVHGPGRDKHLRHEHLVVFEFLAHHAHAGQQPLLQHVLGGDALVHRLLYQFCLLYTSPSGQLGPMRMKAKKPATN